MTAQSTIGVIGAGAWGTALAQVAARGGNSVFLWARRPELAAAIERDRTNADRLPGITLDPGIVATADPGRLREAGIWLLAMPAQEMRATLARFASTAAPGRRIVITAKGIERDTGRFLADVLLEIIPGAEPLVLSGPSFAGDVARGLPTAVTLAARSLDIARPVAEVLSQPAFRPYISDDLIGVEIGGAVKNVLAIACGAVTGLGLGDSARAALIARAFAELSRLGRALGARPETLAGLSGLGDLVLTCSSPQSRNFQYGQALGRGETPDRAAALAGGIVEGAKSATAALDVARANGIEAPIIEAVCSIVSGTARAADMVARLMQRPLKAED